MATERLFETDPYKTEFEAVVTANTVIEGRQGAILNSTLFYPHSGGQPCDRGTLGGYTVLDVLESENGAEIIHILDGVLHVQDAVTGQVDFAYRFDHMQQHTGQHLLSASFYKLFKAITVGFHMGDRVSTLDLSLNITVIEKIEEAEMLANQVVSENRPVICTVVDQKTFCSLPLRKKPPEMEEIRLVNIDEFDWSACCGTHVRSTGEIGLIKIINFEKHKQGCRITFVCGQRALQNYQSKIRVLSSVCRTLTVGEDELSARIDGLLEEQRELKKSVKEKQAALLSYEIQDILKNAEKRDSYSLVVKIFDDRSPKDLQFMVRSICERDDILCIAGLRHERGTVIIGRSENITIDIAGLKNTAEKILDGKGGGNQVLTQTSGTDSTKVDAAVTAAVNMLE